MQAKTRHLRSKAEHPPPLTPIGAPAPWIAARTRHQPRFHLHTIAGRYVAMVFLSATASAQTLAQTRALAAATDLYTEDHRALIIIAAPGIKDEALPADGRGVRVLIDEDGAQMRAFGARCGLFVLLDPHLRVLATAPLAAAKALMETPPYPEAHAGAETPAPVLMLPRVFEPEFVAHLLSVFAAGEPADSGFMRDVEGKTRLIVDHGHKRRSDVLLTDESLQAACKARLATRLIPEIARAFQFEATRVERFLLARYDGESGGHFRPHRDNTTKGTAHRRFSVSLALNEGYEGGGVRFPEFSKKVYRAPTGGALVFSCSLLHEALPITRGERFVFLPFLYDEAAAKIREANRGFLDLN